MAWMGAAIGAAATYFSQKSTNSANTANVSSTNQLDIDLANSAYQRRVQDLKAAGLNPMLAYQAGGAQSPTMGVPQLAPALGNAVSSGVQAYQAGKQADLINSQLKLVDSQATTQQTQQLLNKALAAKAVADADVSAASASEISQRMQLIPSQMAQINASIDKIAADTKLTFQQTLLVKRQIQNAVLTGENISVDTGNKLADNRLKALSYELGKYSIPTEQNKFNAAESWYGRNVMPFLPSFVQSATVLDKTKP